jgi:four helix bundle protein
VSDFKKLLVWQKAHALALDAHRIAISMRRSHDLPLRSQIIRAAMSMPANIAEGRRQKSEKEFARFLHIALNSGFELEYHLIVAQDIGAMSEADFSLLLRKTVEVRKMLHGLLKRIDDRLHEQSAPTSPDQRGRAAG